jgi:hypothetical protein
MSPACPSGTTFVQCAAIRRQLDHRFKIEEKARTRTFNIIRRTINALDEYELARTSYHAIFESEQKSTAAYLRALHHFEVCIAQLMQAHELFFGMIDSEYRNKNGTGREELNDRLARIYNDSKHTEGRVKAQGFEDGDTLAVWISDSGLNSKKTQIAFNELYEVMCDMADVAKLLANGEGGP